MKKIFQGKYLFHIHTTRTDGHVTVAEYFERAAELGYERLIFLEHIRREPTYDVEDFVAEIHEVSRKFRLEAYVGFEAKILPSGQLDIRDEHVELASVIGIAEHGRPPADPQKLFVDVLSHELARFTKQSVVWVHPGLWLTRDIRMLGEDPRYWSMVRRAVESGILIEINLRYGRLPPDLAARLDADQLVYGCDAHRLTDLLTHTPPLALNSSN